MKSFLQLHKFVPSPRALERCVDRSTKIDTTYAFVSNSISALIWFNSFGLMNQGYFRNFFIFLKKKKISKSLNMFSLFCVKISNCVLKWLYSWVKWMRSILVTLVSFFPSPRVFVPEKNPSSLLFVVVWFVPAVVTENLHRAQLSFSFLSVVGISVYC